MEAYAGILPHPDDLAAFEKAQPGAADRILVMAERQIEHRQECEKRELEIIENRDRRYFELTDEITQREHTARMRGQAFALIVALVGLVSAIVVGWILGGAAGASAASVIGGTSLGALVYAFLRANREQPDRAEAERDKSPGK